MSSSDYHDDFSSIDYYDDSSSTEDSDYDEQQGDGHAAPENNEPGGGLHRATGPIFITRAFEGSDRFNGQWNNREHCDLVVRFNGTEIMCHCVILAHYSNWFSKRLLRRPDVISLGHIDEPAVVSAIRFCYGFRDYRIPKPDSPCFVTSMMFLLRLYCAAVKYRIPLLKAKLVSQVRKQTSAFSEAWLDMLRSDDLIDNLSQLFRKTREGDPMRHEFTLAWHRLVGPLTQQSDRDALLDLLQEIPAFAEKLIYVTFASSLARSEQDPTESTS